MDVEVDVDVEPCSCLTAAGYLDSGPLPRGRVNEDSTSTTVKPMKPR